MAGIEELQLWTEDDYARLNLRLISDEDDAWPEFAAANRAIIAGGTVGVQIKEFLIDRENRAWMAKSGALSDKQVAEGNQNPDASQHIDDETERGRRIAFPLHESLAPMMLRAIGLLTNDVNLGVWRFLIKPAEAKNEELNVAFHKLVPGKRRDHVDGFHANAQYV